MKTKILVITVLAVGVTAFMAGTALSVEGEKDKQAKMPEPPPPPPELKALNAFVGQWRGTYEHLPAMFGEAATGTGVGKYEWVLDGWFLKAEGTGTSSYGTHKSIWLMTYDPMMKTYRSFSFDNFGMCEIATMTHDPKTRTWTALSEGVDMSGKPAKNKFTMRFVSDDKLEWEWQQKSQGETEFKLLMKGTDTRVGRP